MLSSVATRGAVVLASALLTGGLIPASPTNAAPGPQGDQAESLAWGPCPAGTPVPPGAAELPRYECAVTEVPLSYRNPSLGSVRLAIGRLPAADQHNKLGTIFYNPGGPGNPGRIPPKLTGRLHERFDIVGFDPRGIAASDGLRCFKDPHNRELFADAFPITPEQQRQQIAKVKRGVRLCARNAGELIGRMSTANVARDMDHLRQLLGERQLSFYGHSYGGYLGTVYGNLFPDRVGAMVLDSPPDPVRIATERPADAAIPASYRIGGFLGAQQALRAFLDECASDPRCAIREPGIDLLDKYNGVLDRLLTGPVTISGPNGKPREVTYQVAVGQSQGMLANASNSPELARFLQALHEAPSGSTKASDEAERPYVGVEQGTAICLDSTNPRDPRAVARFARKADRVARGFGSLHTYLVLACTQWPEEDPDRYRGPWDRHTANPILVLGNGRGDPNSSYQGIRRATGRLDDARLLTLDSFGHGVLRRSQCIDDALNHYFIRGALPEPGSVCTPDREPFDG